MRLFFVCAALLLTIHGVKAKDDVLVGAIRWDAWFAGSPWATTIVAKQWNYRLPFFAQVGPRGDASTINGLDRGVMGREVLYAGSAGVDYFIFGLYADRAPDGSELSIMANFRKSIDLFTTLNDKHGMRFSFWVDPNQYQSSQRIQELAIQYVRDASFLRTSDDRPVIFLFIPNADTWIDDVGGIDKAKAFQYELQTSITTAVGKRPYIVAMTFSPSAGSRLIAPVGFDALTSYGNPLGLRTQDESSGEKPYARCLGASQYYWSIARQSGRQFFPPVSLGWDYRPAIDDEGRAKDPEWCISPTTKDIKRAIQDAIGVAPAADVIRSVVIYAWNEYSEGGWLAPSLCEGADRLMGVAEARGRKFDLADALRDAPLPSLSLHCQAPEAKVRPNAPP